MRLTSDANDFVNAKSLSHPLPPWTRGDFAHRRPLKAMLERKLCSHGNFQSSDRRARGASIVLDARVSKPWVMTISDKLCQVCLQVTVLTKQLLIWSMMELMICVLFCSRHTLRRTKRQRYDSTVWLVARKVASADNCPLPLTIIKITGF